MRYCIIGGSVAGISCAARLRKLEPGAEVIVLSEEDYPYSKMTLPYLLSGKVSDTAVRLPVPEGVFFLEGKRAIKISPEEKTVFASDGTAYSYDKLLIATGARATVPDFEGSLSPRSFTVRNLSDISRMKTSLGSPSADKVLISGAGLVSIEMGDALWRLGFTPVFLVTSRRLLTVILDEEGSSILEEDLPRKGVEIRFGTTIGGASIKGDRIVVETKDGAQFDGQILVIGKGTTPNVEFLASSGIDLDWGVLVNEYLETTQKDIFAAGDVCQGYDSLFRDRRINALWPVAIEQGRHAAFNMTRPSLPYSGSMTRNIVTAFGNSVFTAGLSNTRELQTLVRRSGAHYAKIVCTEGRLAGCIFINAPVDPGVYVTAIAQGLEVSGIEETLLSGALSYAHFHPFLGRG
ncbi:MAG: NAD(P)/FAD-dependent oxidoreductase [Deltaproteobacteria bacterium]|nr:NAD(P)/FAD-dependent oxidoreductase [Deltaproteobacteria bacterium]